MADKELDLRLPPITSSENSPRRQTYRTPRTEASMSLPPLSYRSAQSFDPRRPTYHNHVVYGSPLWHRDSVQTAIKPLPSSAVIKSLEVGFVNDAVKTAIFTRPRKIPIIPHYYAERDKCARAYFKSPMVQDTIAKTSKSSQIPIKAYSVDLNMIIKDTNKKDVNEEIFVTQRNNHNGNDYPKPAVNGEKEDSGKTEDNYLSINQRMLPIEIANTLPADETNTGPNDPPSQPPLNGGEDSDSDYGHPDHTPSAPPGKTVTTLPEDTADNLPAVETDFKPGPCDEATTLPVETEDNPPDDQTGTRPDKPGDKPSTPPTDTVDNLPVDEHKDDDEGTGKDRPDNVEKYPDLWPNEKYSKEYRGLPEFIVRLYTEEYDVRGSRPTVNKLSVRHRCRSTPTADDLKRLEKQFVNDAIITERKRTKYKDIIPPYDASADRNARGYFMREDIKHLLGVTRSAR